MNAKARKNDEVRVKLGSEVKQYLYIDYDQDGWHEFWPNMSVTERWEVLIALLRLCGDQLPPVHRVKLLFIEGWCTAMLEKSKGDAPIKDEPPF